MPFWNARGQGFRNRRAAVGAPRAWFIGDDACGSQGRNEYATGGTGLGSGRMATPAKRRTRGKCDGGRLGAREPPGRREGDLDATRASAASGILLRHWRDGLVLEALPTSLRPSTRAEGYAIQAQLEASSRHGLWGWKIAATSLAGQRHIGVDGPLAGRLLAEMVHPDGASLSIGANRMRVAEPEFAFRIARDLPPRGAPYAVDEVLGAIASLHPAIEIPIRASPTSRRRAPRS